MWGFCLFYIMDIYWINIIFSGKCFNLDENYFINDYFLGKCLWNLILASHFHRNYDDTVVLYLISFVFCCFGLLFGCLLYRWTLPWNDFCVSEKDSGFFIMKCNRPGRSHWVDKAFFSLSSTAPCVISPKNLPLLLLECSLCY